MQRPCRWKNQTSKRWLQFYVLQYLNLHIAWLLQTYVTVSVQLQMSVCPASFCCKTHPNSDIRFTSSYSFHRYVKLERPLSHSLFSIICLFFLHHAFVACVVQYYSTFNLLSSHILSTQTVQIFLYTILFSTDQVLGPYNLPLIGFLGLFHRV